MSQGAPSDAGTPALAREPIHPLPPTPEGAPRKKPGNLVLRLVTAAMLIPPVIYVIMEGGLWALGTIVVITLLGVNEFYQLIEAKGAEPLRGVGTLAAVALPVVSYLGSDYAATVLMSFLLLGLMVAQLGKAQISDSLASISGTFFGVFYVGWLLSHFIALRGFHGVVQGRWGADAVAVMHPDAGAFYLLFTISVVIAGDAGAYFVGRKYGRRKLAPRVSPSKTVEGAMGALAGGLLVGLAAKALFDTILPELSAQFGWIAVIVLSPLLAGVGIVGDLVESLLKRDAQVKDTGSLLPGTGGVLDRIDSNLLAVPVMYYLLLAHTFLFGRVPLPSVGAGPF
ncbi:MAG: phosphatidate cytidylyltransferase [Myxococcota bacterium]